MLKKVLLIMFFVPFASFLMACTELSENQEQNLVSTEMIEATQNKSSDVDAEIPDTSISSYNLVYCGAFRLPDDGGSEKAMFSYGGEALCYNPANDSLFITGHNWYANVAEITIPTAINSKDISVLNQAEIINGFFDIKGYLFSDWTMEIIRAGLEVVDDKLFFCYGKHYEEDTANGTHGYTDLDFGKPKKVCVVGDYLYSTNDYMFAIPDAYRAYFGGNNLLTGRFRDGGWSGMGPSLFAISTKDIISAENDEKINAHPLIKYDDSYNEENGKTMRNYSHADSWTGGAFVCCEAGSGVLFIGTHGFGNTWYGFANGVVYPTDGDEDAVYPEVPEYPYDERGWWNDDFRACIAFYSAEDLANVFAGNINPSDIQPYEFADLTEYMMINRDETEMQYLGAAAYDERGNRLFILELMADEDKPIIHVFTFE